MQRVQKLLVNQENKFTVLQDLLTANYIGFDTETYGLRKSDDFFSLQFSTSRGSYYFNFKDYGGEVYVWTKESFFGGFVDIFNGINKTWFIHNAKFDMHRLCNHGVYIEGKVHCTQAIEKIIYNQHLRYSLDACLKRLGKSKNDGVEKEIKESKLYTMQVTDAKKTKTKQKHYDKVKFETMFEYGCDDAADVLYLGTVQLQRIAALDYQTVYDTECALTKATFAMEIEGVLLNLKQVSLGRVYEQNKQAEAIDRIGKIAGEEYKSGPKWLTRNLDKFGVEYAINPKTENPIFDKAALAKIDHPIVSSILEARRREKFATTYYGAFLEKHENGKLYATINQAGTDTGRLSYYEPNLQNVPKEDADDFAEPFQVRGSFVPDEDFCFVMIDFDQQEFRLMLDYAGETQLIRNIMDNGLDIHQATGDMVGIPRKPAKSLNFGLLYGMGEGALAEMLKLPTVIEKNWKGQPVTKSKEAKELIDTYFNKLPSVEKLLINIKDVAAKRGYIKTWAGRRLNFPNKADVYKAPNHLIQGGCGDITKVVLPLLVDYLKPMRSKVLIQVHDEVIFKVHKNELEIVPTLRKIMEDVYKPKNGMYLTCGVEHSWVSWGKKDIVNGYPTRS